jgi:hypothetical protein
MSGMVQLMTTQGTIGNRTEMHTSVRSATELLQQEIGQAGRVSLSAPNTNVTMSAVATGSQSISLTPASASVYPGEVLTIDVGSNQETVTVTGSSSAPTATFAKTHASNTTPVNVLGAFATGVVPPDNTTVANNCAPAGYTPVAPFDTKGSNCTTLKLYGDINGDGNMVYVEYTCNQGTAAAPGILYRNQMPYTQTAAKAAVDNTMILLSNVLQNPNSANGVVPCFNYQTRALGTGYVVTNVAVTLTVQTQNRDPLTGQFQPETKALLNVGPRNVIEVYDTASLVDPTRAQVMPTTVQNLL